MTSYRASVDYKSTYHELSAFERDITELTPDEVSERLDGMNVTGLRRQVLELIAANIVLQQRLRRGSSGEPVAAHTFTSNERKA